MSDVIVAKLRLITFNWNAKADYLTFRKRGYKNTLFPGKSDSVLHYTLTAFAEKVF